MLTRVLTLGGCTAYALAGPLLLVGLWPTGPQAGARWVALGAAAAWLGVGGVLGALLVVGRHDHRTLRELARRTDGLRREVRALRERDVVDAAALSRELETLRAEVTATVGEERRELQAVLDARVLGLHGLVRELVDDAGEGS